MQDEGRTAKPETEKNKSLGSQSDALGAVQSNQEEEKQTEQALAGRKRTFEQLSTNAEEFAEIQAKRFKIEDKVGSKKEASEESSSANRVVIQFQE